jgi:hypothetical protein
MIRMNIPRANWISGSYTNFALIVRVPIPGTRLFSAQTGTQIP